MEISKICPVCHQSFKAREALISIVVLIIEKIVKDFIGSIKKIKTRIYFSVLLDKYYKIKNSQLHIVITSYLLK